MWRTGRRPSRRWRGSSIRDCWKAEQPLRIVFIGTEFETRVWQTLLKVPLGRATTYSDIAGHIGNPKASRAVGAAVGRNPISFVVPCHRVLGKSGGLVRLPLGADPQAGDTGLGGRDRLRRVQPRPEALVPALRSLTMMSIRSISVPDGGGGRPSTSRSAAPMSTSWSVSSR